MCGHSKTRVLTKLTHYMVKDPVEDWDRFEILAAVKFTQRIRALAAKMKKVFHVHYRVHGRLFLNTLHKLAAAAQEGA